jgi:hypothetical protein
MEIVKNNQISTINFSPDIIYAYLLINIINTRKKKRKGEKTIK